MRSDGPDVQPALHSTSSERCLCILYCDFVSRYLLSKCLHECVALLLTRYCTPAHRSAQCPIQRALGTTTRAV